MDAGLPVWNKSDVETFWLFRVRKIEIRKYCNKYHAAVLLYREILILLHPFILIKKTLIPATNKYIRIKNFGFKKKLLTKCDCGTRLTSLILLNGTNTKSLCFQHTESAVLLHFSPANLKPNCMCSTTKHIVSFIYRAEASLRQIHTPLPRPRTRPRAPRRRTHTTQPSVYYLALGKWSPSPQSLMERKMNGEENWKQWHGCGSDERSEQLADGGLFVSTSTIVISRKTFQSRQEMSLLMETEHFGCSVCRHLVSLTTRWRQKALMYVWMDGWMVVIKHNKRPVKCEIIHRGRVKLLPDFFFPTGSLWKRQDIVKQRLNWCSRMFNHRYYPGILMLNTY